MEIDHITLWDAFYNWFAVKDGTYGQAVRSFYEFTGINSFFESHRNLTAEQVRRIELMAGPHGKTLIKAMIAKEVV